MRILIVGADSAEAPAAERVAARFSHTVELVRGDVPTRATRSLEALVATVDLLVLVVEGCHPALGAELRRVVRQHGVRWMVVGRLDLPRLAAFLQALHDEAEGAAAPHELPERRSA